LILPKARYIGQSGRLVWLPFFFLLGLAVNAVAAEEVRALWVVRHDITTRERVDSVISHAVNAGINTLFVQVRGRGDAYYKSEFVSEGEQVEPGFDPLAACLAQAHDASIEVHAWMNVYLTWYPNRPASDMHLLVKHPGWFMISDDGVDHGQAFLDVDLVDRGVEGRYLSPANPEAQSHLLRVIAEIVDAYPVDGIHLDYVRYPNEHYDYSPLAQSSLWAETEMNPPGSESSALELRVWRRWRSGLITDFVRRAKHLISQRRPSALLSAAVKPDLASAYERYGQDWVHWVNRRYLDFAVPMFYTGSLEDIQARMQVVRKYVQRGRIYAGIGAWNQSATETFEQIELMRRSKLNGFSLFSYTTLLSSPELQQGLSDRFGSNAP